jgi:hypothetical protein
VGDKRPDAWDSPVRNLTPISHDAMIVAFLQAELASPVWEGAIRDGVDGFRLDDLRVITEPNLDDPVEREKRRATLSSYRGYGRNTYAFNRFPDDVEWFRGVASLAEVADMRLMDFPEAQSLSGGTRIVRDAASNIATVAADTLNGRVLAIAEAISRGATLPPLITVARTPSEVHVILEGNTRAIALALQSDHSIDVDVITGYSAAIEHWCFF